MSEYVKLSSPEVIYGNKKFLESQIHIISMQSRYQAYKKLRSEELILKITLKNKIDEAQKLLIILDKILPKVAMHERHEHHPQIVEKQSNEMIGLEQELEHIRRKLAQLG